MLPTATAVRIKRLFNEAKRWSPSIVYIEDLDIIAGEERNPKSAKAYKQRIESFRPPVSTLQIQKQKHRPKATSLTGWGWLIWNIRFKVKKDIKRYSAVMDSMTTVGD
ncbi:hypothetical protein Tco_1577982 [Tanacetum coccineum]